MLSKMGISFSSRQGRQSRELSLAKAGLIEETTPYLGELVFRHRSTPNDFAQVQFPL